MEKISHKHLLNIAMWGFAVYISVGSALAVGLTASDIWNDSILGFEKSNARGSNIAAWEVEPPLRLWEFLGNEDLSALFNVLESPHIKNGTYIDSNLPIIDRMMGIDFTNSLNITDRKMIPLNFKFSPTHTVISRPKDTVFGVSEESRVGEDGKKIEKDSKTEPLVGSTSLAVQFLSSRMDVFHKTFDVYIDFDSPGNHFLKRVHFKGTPLMEEAYTVNPHSGMTAIRASTSFKTNPSGWSGGLFMNGILKGKVKPNLVGNWADHPNTGIDLSGAEAINFWARGAEGGERVKFFAFGVGLDQRSFLPKRPFPESSPRISSGYVELSKDWKSYKLDVRKQDLSYILTGFAWVVEKAKINGNHDITFFIDDIQYSKPHLEEPRFLVSHEIIASQTDSDNIFRSAAYIYDNALALFAFLASGDPQRAKLVADALVYVQKHDRFYEDGRIRNAYQGGDLAHPPGWLIRGKTATARMPSGYDPKTKKYLIGPNPKEDSFQIGTETGTVAWAILALLAYSEVADSTDYLRAAERMGEWVDHCCHDKRGAGGYRAGFEGLEPKQIKLKYKSTKHNISLLAAFERMYKITGRKVWKSRAFHAKKFVLAMWDETEGKYWTGTKRDGVSLDKKVIPIDVQTMVGLALGFEDKTQRRALQYLESHLNLEDGVDFNKARDATSYEEIAKIAVAYQFTNQMEKSERAVDFLKKVQSSSGGLPSDGQAGLSPDLINPNERSWINSQREQVAATAWFVLAEHGFNPFLGYAANKVQVNRLKAEGD